MKFCKTPYTNPLKKQKHDPTDGLSMLAAPFTYDPSAVIPKSKIKALEVWLKSTDDKLVDIPSEEVSKDPFKQLYTMENWLDINVKNNASSMIQFK